MTYGAMEDDDQFDDEYEEEEFEYSASFAGPCTCPENCPNYDDPNGHSWGDCGEELPDGTECPCEAGWEE